MGYVYLSLALAGGLIKGFLGKRISSDVHTLKDCLQVNFIRMLFCAGFSGVLLFADIGFSLPPLSALPFYLFSAVCMAAFCITFMFGYKTAAYMYLSIFGMMGSVFTGLLGCAIYNEPLSMGKLFGMILLLSAVICLSKYNKLITLRETAKVLPLLMIAAVSSALSDFSQKIYVYTIGESATAYNFYTYAFASLLLFPALFPLKRNSTRECSSIQTSRQLLYCILIAAAQFLNTYSKTLAASYLAAAEIYPVLQGANLIASAVLAHFLLKEKITKRCLGGIVIAWVGLILMNLF